MDKSNIAGITLNLADAGLSAGTTNTYSTANATVCAIRGKFATSLAAQTNAATPTTDATTGAAFKAVSANQGTVLVFGVNSAGAIQLAQGSIVDTEAGSGATAGNFVTAPQFPALPADFCPIGYVLVRVAPSGGSFTAGTTSWAATGISSTFVNVAALPDRPQVA